MIAVFLALTHFFAMFPFDPQGNIGKKRVNVNPYTTRIYSYVAVVKMRQNTEKKKMNET